jgi:hypothetical protein
VTGYYEHGNEVSSSITDRKFSGLLIHYNIIKRGIYSIELSEWCVTLIDRGGLFQILSKVVFIMCFAHEQLVSPVR